MGNYCEPDGKNDIKEYDGMRPVKSQYSGVKNTKLYQTDSSSAPRYNIVVTQLDCLDSGSDESLIKMTSPVDMNRADKESVLNVEHHEYDTEILENKLPENKNLVDKPKETFHRTSISIDRSSSNTYLASEELQSLDQDTEPDVILLEQFLTPKSITVEEQRENIISPQQRTSLISLEHKHKWSENQFRRDDEGETACLVNMLVVEINSAAEQNETLARSGYPTSLSEGKTLREGKVMLQQVLQMKESEALMLENEILEKKNLIGKQDETLAQLNQQRAERARDLKDMEYRIANIRLHTVLKKRAFRVAKQQNEEKSSRTVTLVEGRLFKFGSEDMTDPKEKWVQVRLYPKGQVILDYAELFFSAKFVRNQIISVERGEKYYSGDSSSYRARIFAVRSTSTTKNRWMVFVADSDELCEHWIETIKGALEQKPKDFDLKLQDDSS